MNKKFLISLVCISIFSTGVANQKELTQDEKYALILQELAALKESQKKKAKDPLVDLQHADDSTYRGLPQKTAEAFALFALTSNNPCTQGFQKELLAVFLPLLDMFAQTKTADHCKKNSTWSCAISFLLNRWALLGTGVATALGSQWIENNKEKTKRNILLALYAQYALGLGMHYAHQEIDFDDQDFEEEIA